MNIGKLAERAKAVVDKNTDKIAVGVGRATDFVDKKTKGKHHARLEKLEDLAAKHDKSKHADPVGDAPAAGDTTATTGHTATGDTATGDAGTAGDTTDAGDAPGGEAPTGETPPAL